MPKDWDKYVVEFENVKPLTPSKPSVGHIVHYVSYGTPNGEYEPEHRAAIITAVVDALDSETGVEKVHLCVLNPEGLFFNKNVRQDEATKRGGTWHWPEGFQ